MIYLFSNASYGQPFVEAAASRHRRDGGEITVILSGRGAPARKLSPGWVRWRLRAISEVRRMARRHRLPVRLVEDVNAEAFRSAIGPGDHGIVAGFNQIFSAGVIGRFESLVNFHPSLLPLYRGPVPSHWVIHHREKVSGFTLHEVTSAVDEGRILDQELVPIQPDDTPERLDARIAATAVLTLDRYMQHLAAGPTFAGRRVDAHAAYEHHIDYRSFPVPGAQSQRSS